MVYESSLLTRFVMQHTRIKSFSGIEPLLYTLFQALIAICIYTFCYYSNSSIPDDTWDISMLDSWAYWVWNKQQLVWPTYYTMKGASIKHVDSRVGGWCSQMTNLQHKPYLVKVFTKGKGLKFQKICPRGLWIAPQSQNIFMFFHDQSYMFTKSPPPTKPLSLWQIFLVEKIFCRIYIC